MIESEKHTQTEPVTFLKFRSVEQANAVSEILGKAGIYYEIIRERQYFDPSFAFNKTEPDIDLLIRQEDFTKARAALQSYYESQLDSVDKDYYLFQFSHKELTEIIEKPDEWGTFDYALAKRILQNLGIFISKDEEDSIMTGRISELSKPDSKHSFWVIIGYFAAVIGGFPGIIIGWLLVNLTRTLPNGEKVFVYSDADRKHGKIILKVSIFFFFLFIAIQMVKQYS